MFSCDFSIFKALKLLINFTASLFNFSISSGLFSPFAMSIAPLIAFKYCISKALVPKTIFSLGLLRPSRINIGVSPFFPSISALFVSKGTPKFFCMI
ncbi:hypothetical protein A3305_02950 [Rickettsia amblyommatis]|nr:hypothetical protein AL573_00805 [Rickettsia amblyommatis]ARD88123.1 hypothetical protein A3305_02950 [Rickettsia amblyommatis]